MIFLVLSERSVRRGLRVDRFHLVKDASDLNARGAVAADAKVQEARTVSVDVGDVEIHPIVTKMVLMRGRDGGVYVRLPVEGGGVVSWQVQFEQ